MDHWRDWTCAASIRGWVKAEKRHTSRHLGLGQPMDHAVPLVQLVFGGESMSGYIFRRLLGMIPTLAIISVIVFVLIQLPPGDIVTANLASLQSQGMEASEEKKQAL